MSKKSLAMQIPPSSHTDRPDLHDLLTINLSDPKMWYNIGLELGLTVSALNAIKTKHGKPQPCKRAMFKEWMNTCPPETCTWSHLIPALRRVDPKTAEVISETVAREALPQSDHPRTSLFPLQKSKRDEASISTASLPPSLIGSRRERPWTDIVQDPTASLPVHKAAEQRLSMGDVKSGGRTEDDYCPLLKSYRDDQSRESRSQSSHGSGETRSVSGEEYQTAGEDDSIQPFVTYQQDEQRITSGASSDPVITKLIDSVKSGSTEVIKLMIERGEVTPRTRLPGNKSLLMYATFQDSKGLVEYLLRVEGFNSLTDTDENGAMTLYFAVSEGLFEIAKILVNQHIRRGLGLNHFVKGTPLLIFPAAKGFSMICELLLENRADPNLKNRDGETALIVSASRGHKGVVQVLLKFNADIDTVSRKSSRTALEEALHFGHAEVTKVLMRASSTAKENNLKLFSCKTREEISQLIKAGAKVNTRHGDETTPIMLHAQRGSIDLVQELLYHHANVDLQDEAGETALMKASAFGQVEVVDALIGAGTIINLRKTNGHTALAVAVLNQQLRIINKLLLAGADPTIKDKNGHSIEELARATNNQDIIEAIRRSRSTLKQEGQFIDLLSSYLQKGDEANAAKKEDITEKAMKKEELRKKLPKSSHAPQEEESTHKKELEKAYKRIGDLETRVNDLTAQVTMEIPGDEQLTHLERDRLEGEFRKLKELKRKTEQYAVEAKQHAQRLSAENFKLREDLSKERHHNELTHKSILRDMEDLVDKSDSLEERNQAKKEVFEQEVAKRAKQLVLSSAVIPHKLGSFKFTPAELKLLIFKHSVRISHNLVVVGGLPFSGKSTLLHNMLQLKDNKEGHVCTLHGLSVMEAAVISNPYVLDQSLPWLSAITKEDAELLMFAACFAQVYAKRSQSLTSAIFEEEEASDSLSAQQSPKFKISAVNQYLDRAFKRLKDLCSKPQCNEYLDSLQFASLAFMNIWDIGINKAVFEIMSLLARKCHGLVLLNVLSLKDDAENLNKKLSLKDRSRYQGRYSSRKDDERVLQVQKAITYYARFVSVCNTLPNSSLLIGTHKDSHEGNKENLMKLSAQVKSSVEEAVSGLGFGAALHSQMLTINAQSGEDAKKVCETVEKMIMQDHRFEKEVPLTWILLRGVLQTTEKMFLQKAELWHLASDCGLQSWEELEAWLKLFQQCMSIIYSVDGALPSLTQNVVIHPFKFVESLDRLYYADFDKKLKSEPNVKTNLDLLQRGILTYTFAGEIWPDDSDTTARHKIQNEKCNFMLRVLQDLKIATKLDLAIYKSEEEPFSVSSAEQLYFIPSCRHYFSHSQLSRDSCSLIITVFGIHQAPFDVYSEFLRFIQQLQQERIKLLKFVRDQQYDAIHLKWVESEVLQADIHFRLLDFEDYVEVSVCPSVKPGVHESHIFALKQRVCSMMKTICVEFFHKVSQFVSNMKYEFCIVSPDCPKEDQLHLVPFQIVGDQDHQNLECKRCKKKPVPLQQSQDRTLWITCAYQGSAHLTVSASDTLSRLELVNIADELYKHKNSSSMTTRLGRTLGIQEAETQSLKQYCTSDDFPLLILLEWKKRQAVASRPQLAKALLQCGFESLAQKLDTTVGSSTPTLQHRLVLAHSRDDSRITMAIQRVPHTQWKELGEKLGLAREDIQLLMQANPQNKQVISDAVQRWLRSQQGDALHTLTKVLRAMNLHTIESLLQHSDDDSLWLK